MPSTAQDYSLVQPLANTLTDRYTRSIPFAPQPQTIKPQQLGARRRPPPVSAVQWDGNACLHRPGLPWNPSSNSSTYFLSWWEAPTQPNPNGQNMVSWVQNGWDMVDNFRTPAVTAYAFTEEATDVPGYADLVTGIGGPINNEALYATTKVAPIPRNGLWHLVGEWIDTVTLQGAFGVVEEGGNHVEFAPLTISAPNGPFTKDWTKSTDWYLGCDTGYTSANIGWYIGPMAEFYLNISDFLTDPLQGSHFATNQGQAVGLSYSVALHDCGLPTGSYPTMCHTGGPNSFVVGPGYTYTMMETGVLKGVLTPPGDPCQHSSRSQDGCQ